MLLHLPMLVMAHRMGNHLAGMPMDAGMTFGMGLIMLGVPLACWGALPKHRIEGSDGAAASSAAHALEPTSGWRSLWLQGFPTGLLLLALARFIPETPGFLVTQGRTCELCRMEDRFGLDAMPCAPASAPQKAALGQAPHTSALIIAALCWSFVNFGLLLWLPSTFKPAATAPRSPAASLPSRR